MFGFSASKPLRKHARVERRVAKLHDARFIEADMPEGYRRWFATRNWGHPHDQATAYRVYRDLAAAGVPREGE